MPYDEQAAARAEAELAAVTEGQMVAEVRAGFAEVVAAQRAWHSDATYPDRDDAMRGLFDKLHRLVITAEAAMHALPPEVSRADVVATVRPMLGAYFPAQPELAGAMCAALDRLRYTAISRPSLVSDARRLRGR